MDTQAAIQYLVATGKLDDLVRDHIAPAVADAVSASILDATRQSLVETRAKLEQAERELKHMKSASPSLLAVAYEQQAKRLAEVEARCADVERERDEARRVMQDAERHRAETYYALAASQAECARLREAGDAVYARLFFGGSDA